MYPLWFIITLCTVAYLAGVYIINRFLMLGEPNWYERILAALWPVSIPLTVVAFVLKEIFWPS